MNFLVIEGNIGAGKSSLATKITQQFNASLILEDFAENPFLPKFYKDKKKYSFPLELSFLTDRYNQLQNELNGTGDFKKFTVSDYYFTKSLIFSRSNLSDDEYELYKKIFEIIYNTLPKPDLYVYLHVAVKNLLKNIKARGRQYEQTIEAGYLQKIEQSYFSYFAQNPDCKFLIIDANCIDYVHDESHYQLIINTIFGKEYKTGINRVTLSA